MLRPDIAARHKTHSRGQAIAEFALLLPMILGIVGAGIDFSRGFAASMTLESAARNAAEAAAYEATTLTQAQGIARRVLCVEARRLPGFVPGPGNDVETCTNPTFSLTYTRDATAPGANSRYPLVTVTVATTIDFALAVPWPFIPHNTWTLGSTQSFEILQGR